MSDKHAFWQQLPVNLTVESETGTWLLRPEDTEPAEDPPALLELFEWCSLDVANENVLHEIKMLLCSHYVEDSKFFLSYSEDLLRWILCAPGWNPDLLAGVRLKTTGKLVATFLATPLAALRVFSTTIDRVSQFNFLCVHRKLRERSLGSVLIRELTRRSQRAGFYAAIYTSVRQVPAQIAQLQYYHRLLRPKRAIELNFWQLPPRLSLKQALRLYALPETPKLSGLRKFKNADVASARILLAAGYAQCAVAPDFRKLSDETLVHMFLSRPGVLSTYVVDSPAGGLDGLFSYYHLRNEQRNSGLILAIGYAYYAATTPDLSLEQLLNDVLSCAVHQDNLDVFNAANIWPYTTRVLESTKFIAGNGTLNFYLGNWRCPAIDAHQVGVVLP